eukprot:gnl/MRDRNA2_/MRDRNA2_35662_c0_seq1.p1 gnl/MRDRNA2_/MRDRNA2_35662_c0~~gnl/MRDRNA2_/MRDRNA2_35662_c0_seq1.p1  ORF type:complete len:262 (+),score=39.54 gnl/MRDRNA2_/MRDRNA2_35662_c0_seq1:166-951(+)
MVEEGRWRQGFVEAVCQKETQHLGDLRVHTSFSVSPNRDEVNDHRNKYMVPENDADSSSNTNLLLVHETDFVSFMKEGGENASLSKLREMVDARRNGGVFMAGVTAMAWRKRSSKATGEEDAAEEPRVSQLKSEDKMRGPMGFLGSEDPGSSPTARSSYLPRMSERYSTRMSRYQDSPRYSTKGSIALDSPSSSPSKQRSSGLFASKARRSIREMRSKTQPPTPVFDTVMSLPTKEYGSTRYPKKKLAKTILSTLKAASGV